MLLTIFYHVCMPNINENKYSLFEIYIVIKFPIPLFTIQFSFSAILMITMYFPSSSHSV